MLRLVTATRFVIPLREGGSLPALVEADDGRLYVVKWRGAGQGALVGVAELLCGELATMLGLPTPERVLVNVPPALGRNEPEPQLRELLKQSAGLNLGLAFVPGAVSFDPAVPPPPSTELASRIVWFDAWVMNVDRTAKNPNLLCSKSGLWLIDHGAALYFHHGDGSAAQAASNRFPAIKEHVLLPWAEALPQADQALRARVDTAWIDRAVDAIPDDWLSAPGESPASRRQVYRSFFEQRLRQTAVFVEEAARARAQLI